MSFNGTTGAISASYNVTSITHSSTGVWVVNLTTAMSSANYCTVVSSNAGTVGANDTNTWVSAQATGGPTVNVAQGSVAFDATLVNVICYGDQ